MFSSSTPSFICKANLKYTGVHLDYITDDQLSLLLENNMEGGASSSLGNRHVKRRERKIVYQGMTKISRWSTSHFSPTGEVHETELTKRSGKSLLKTFSRTPNNINCGQILEFLFEYPSIVHDKRKLFTCLPDKKQSEWIVLQHICWK